MNGVSIKIEPPDLFDEETFQSVPILSSGTFLNEDYNSDRSLANEVKQEENVKENLEGFYFENDHPALRDNDDYRRLLKAVCVLEAQRARAIRDLDQLQEMKAKALADPVAFVLRLQKGERVDLPPPQEVHPLPQVEWDKYSLNTASTAFGRRQQTRHSTKAAQDLIKSSLRVKPTSKSQKPGSYWTAEEQKRLEELLVEHPPEEVESRRWVKIARSLGNRTAIQVASRVQKYFIKLMKAGMPIPGRMPNMTYVKKPRRHVIRHQPSTFFVSHALPVCMPEEDYSHSFHFPRSSAQGEGSSSEDEEDSFPGLQDSPEYRELLLLRQVQRERSAGPPTPSSKCCRCHVDPIAGTRWRCNECSVDFCGECRDGHIPHHRLEAIGGATGPSLSAFVGSDFSYLKPDYNGE